MIKNFAYVAAMMLVAVFIIGAQTSHAQTLSTMPFLYNTNGDVVNSPGSSPLAAGYYYVGGGPSQDGQEVNYYGNGVYYNMTTQTYGGSITDPNGTAGISINSVAPGTPALGAPNTGAGGVATTNWLILIISGFAFVGSIFYGVATAAI